VVEHRPADGWRDLLARADDLDPANDGGLGEFVPVEGCSASGGLGIRCGRSHPGCPAAVPGRFSNWDRLGKHPLAEPRLQAWFGNHVDWMAKQILEVYEQCGQVEQAPAWLEIDQEIDVAGGVGVPACDRPEDADIASAVASGDRQDLLAYAGKIID
jgi:hypothetical protein